MDELGQSVNKDFVLEKDDAISDDTDAEDRDDEDCENSTWQEDDTWQIIQDQYQGIPTTAFEPGMRLIHHANPAFVHGAVPMPLGKKGGMKRCSQTATRPFQPMTVALKVSCPQCLKIQKENSEAKSE